MQLSLSTAFVALAALVGNVVGQEYHSVTFMNLCGLGSGDPVLMVNGDITYTGYFYESNGPIHAIANLQGYNCGPGGANCTAVETLLANNHSTTQITVSDPYAFSVPVSYSYGSGDSPGAFCGGPDCPGQDIFVGLTTPNSTLLITFCPEDTES